MKVYAEVSLYPLETHSIAEPIDRFVSELKQAGLSVHMGSMSTNLSGEADALLAAVSKAFEAVGGSDRVVMVMKVSNSCPSGYEQKE
ncbi:MAG: thiamine-binding protein [Phycisphaerae bacterium]